MVNFDIERVLTIAEMRALARRRVPKMFYDYLDSGSWTETTYRENESDFGKIKLSQRVAVNLEGRSLKTVIAGQDAAMPVALAPVGLSGMQMADGEIKAARAAEAFGVPFTLSTLSICSIEDIAEHTSRPFMFQLYVMRDRRFIQRLIDRAKAAKCSALVLTMDLQVLGQRHNDLRNQLTAPPQVKPRHIAQTAIRPLWLMRMAQTKRRVFGNLHGHVEGVTDMGSIMSWVADQFDPGLSWADVAWVKERFGGRVIVKGVLDADDARQAVDHGADGIVVSNHGGRQLDGAPSSVRVLPEIAEAVGHRTEVLMDGGVRSGQDVLKALAMGAKGCLIGRAFAYGLGAGGEAGVMRSLKIIQREMDLTMALIGERDVTKVGPHNVYSVDLPPRVSVRDYAARSRAGG